MRMKKEMENKYEVFAFNKHGQLVPVEAIFAWGVAFKQNAEYTLSENTAMKFAIAVNKFVPDVWARPVSKLGD